MTTQQKKLLVSVIILVLVSLGFSVSKQSESVIQDVVEMLPAQTETGATPSPASSPDLEAASESTKEGYLVTRIVDGDTLVIESGQKVRLIGINTPEKGECYFDEATTVLSELVLDKEVQLVKDVSETDRYGRLLRYVYSNGVFVNDVLVAKGYAQATSYPPDVAFQDLFRESERVARENQRGLWSDCEP